MSGPSAEEREKPNTLYMENIAKSCKIQKENRQIKKEMIKAL